jgi:hypothetical protein
MGGGSAFDAYLAQGWTRKKILTGLDDIASHFDNTSNAMPRTYVTHMATRDRPQIYQVAWSADSNRVAIAYHGYLVAAYDRLTGRRIEAEDYLDTRLASLHDYKRCDSEIERFLEQQKWNPQIEWRRKQR